MIDPSPVTRILGRDDACAAVVARLEGGPQLVTVSGPGGIGKSAVAREVARRTASRYGGGVLTCELADARDLEGAQRCVTRAGDGAPMLVVLDDADGVLEPVAALVRGCSGRGAAVSFLVTSREPLGIEQEHEVRLEPLSLDAAVAMFEARADGGAWTRDELERLMEQLDRLPLAIELAARRSRLFPPADLLSRGSEHLRLLRSDRRDVAARHATLEASFAWSLARLSADEDRAFAAIALFAGPVTVEAFEVAVGPLLVGDPVDVVQALLRKSLVACVEAPGSARLTTLHTLHALARERLVALAKTADIDGARARHAAFYVACAEAAAARAYGPGAERALDALAADLPNVLLAFAWTKTREPRLAARAIVALADLVLARNVLDLRSDLFEEARRAGDASGDAALRVATRLVEAKVLLEIGRADAAEARLLEGLDLAETGGMADVADLKRSLGWTRLALGRPDEAIHVLDDALRAHREARHMRGEADALAARGLARCLKGLLDEGHRDLESSYALHTLSGDALRREKLFEMGKLVGLDLSEGGGAAGTAEERAARLRAAAEAHHAGGRFWREAIARLELSVLESTPDERHRQAVLARRIAEAAGVSASIASAIAGAREVGDAGASSSSQARPWVIGPSARWVHPATGEPIDLARHGALRRVLDELVTRRLTEPGSASSALALLEAGWPGERIRHESGMLRVYTVIRRIRALGFGEALVTRDDGYLLDPKMPIERGNERA
jgi:predicted ATPase